MSIEPAASSEIPTASSVPPADVRQRLRGLVTWVLESFGPLLAFWCALRLGGLLVAIITGIVTGALLVVREILRDRKVSPFTAFVAASVVVFGALDLHYRTGFFVKLEPALGNTVTGLFFLGSILWGRPVIIEFAEKAMGRSLGHIRGYLTGWTVVWSAYFFVRAGIYAWMAWNVSLERALAIRGVLGPLSFVGMFALERVVRWILYPSTRR